MIVPDRDGGSRRRATAPAAGSRSVRLATRGRVPSGSEPGAPPASRRAVRRLVLGIVAAVAVAAALVIGLVMLGTTWLVVDGGRTPDPDPPGADTLDRADVERLARVRLPADTADLHTSYAEGIDYSLSACFSTTRQALPGFLAAGRLPPLTPYPKPPGTPPAGCPAPGPELTGVEQDLEGPVYRSVLVGDAGQGRVTVYLRAFTT